MTLMICEYADKCTVKEGPEWNDGNLNRCGHCDPHKHNDSCDAFCQIVKDDDQGMGLMKDIYCVPYIKEFLDKDEFEI